MKEEDNYGLDSALVDLYQDKFDKDFGDGVRAVNITLLPDGRQAATYFGPSGDFITLDNGRGRPYIAYPLSLSYNVY